MLTFHVHSFFRLLRLVFMTPRWYLSTLERPQSALSLAAGHADASNPGAVLLLVEHGAAVDWGVLHFMLRAPAGRKAVLAAAAWAKRRAMVRLRAHLLAL
jgi:hypothetical protein